MGLNLKRPLCFFDLETTGVNVVSDRIVEIAVLKLLPNGNKEGKTWLVNPEMPIPKGASDVHGITNEQVKDAPNFKTLSKEIYNFMKDCDWAGFNSDRFDIPLIAEGITIFRICVAVPNCSTRLTLIRSRSILATPTIVLTTVGHKQQSATVNADVRKAFSKIGSLLT